MGLTCGDMWRYQANEYTGQKKKKKRTCSTG